MNERTVNKKRYAKKYAKEVQREKIEMSPRTAQQQEEIRKNSKNKIIYAALFLFAQKGYYSTTISDIAEYAKISKGLMYNYFKSKDELLDEILEDMLKGIINVEDILKKKKNPREVLEMIFEEIEDGLKNSGDYWKLRTTLFLQPGIMEKYSQRSDDITKSVMEGLNHLFEQAGSKNPKLDTSLFISGLEGIQLLCIYKPDAISLKETGKYLIEKIFNDIDKNN